MLVRLVAAVAFGIAGALPGAVLLLRFDGVWPGLSTAGGDAFWCMQLPAAFAAACGFVAGPYLGAHASSARVTAVSLLIGVVAMAAAFAGHWHGTEGARYVFDAELLRTSRPYAEARWQDFARTARIFLALHPVASALAGWLLYASRDRAVRSLRQAGPDLARASRAAWGAAAVAGVRHQPRVIAAFVFATASVVPDTALLMLFSRWYVKFALILIVVPGVIAGLFGCTVGFHLLSTRTTTLAAIASGAATGALASLVYALVAFPAWLTRNARIPMSVEGYVYVLYLYGGVIVLAVLGQTIAGAFAGWFLHLRR